MRQKHLTSSISTCGRLWLLLSASLLLLLPAAPAAHASDILPTRTTVAATRLGDAGATLTATVTTATGSPVGGGTMDFVLANGQSLGSAQVNAAGTATLSLASLPAATTTGLDGGSVLPVAAEFHGAAGYSDSTSTAIPLATPAVTTAAPDFTLTGNPTTVTVKQGDYGTTAIAVTSVGGFTGPIQFSCQNLPAQVTCTFNPNQQTLAANGSFTTTLQLSTQAASGTASSAIETHSTLALAFAFPGALALIGFVGRRRRSLRHMQWLAIAFVAVGATLGLSGCSQRYGYLHHPPTVATGTPTGTYTIAVTVDGNQVSTVTEHVLDISLVVQ